MEIRREDRVAAGGIGREVKEAMMAIKREEKGVENIVRASQERGDGDGVLLGKVRVGTRDKPRNTTIP